MDNHAALGLCTKQEQKSYVRPLQQLQRRKLIIRGSLPTKHGELAVSEEERKMRNMYKDELAELMFSCARKPEPYTFNNKPAERSIPETKLNSL